MTFFVYYVKINIIKQTNKEVLIISNNLLKIDKPKYLEFVVLKVRIHLKILNVWEYTNT